MCDWEGARIKGQIKVSAGLKRGTISFGDAYSSGFGIDNFFRWSLSGDATLSQ